MSNLGYVETERVVLADAGDPLVLTGGSLSRLEVAYETYGTLNDDRDNAVVVCHALTGDAHAAGMHLGAKRRGWWDNLIGPGRPLDTDRLFVVCANLLGGCQGTTGPSSIDPATGRPYGLDFPILDMRDLVEVHRRLLRHLGIERLHAAVGGSLGGMQVLQWALDHPDEIDRAVLVAASGRLTTENLAFSTVARHAILDDPDFCDGRYLERGTFPSRGMKMARMMAHITYVSDQALERKFGLRRDTTGSERRMGADFAVEHYLQHQGDSFLERFDPLSYLYLSRVMDYFDPFAEVDSVAGPPEFLLVSFDSDWRFSTAHSLLVRDRLAALGAAVAHHEITSPWGHDSFLLEPPGYHDLVRAFVEQGLQADPGSPAHP